MGMYSLLAASQPTVASSEKFGMFCCAEAASANAEQVHMRAVRNSSPSIMLSPASYSPFALIGISGTYLHPPFVALCTLPRAGDTFPRASRGEGEVVRVVS